MRPATTLLHDAKHTRVLATVAGFGNKKATRSVSLLLNGRVIETKQVEVPENGRAGVEFLSLDVPYGRNKGEVRIDTADTLAADDSFYFSVERSDPRHIRPTRWRPTTASIFRWNAATRGMRCSCRSRRAAVDCCSSRRRSMRRANRPRSEERRVG